MKEVPVATCENVGILIDPKDKMDAESVALAYFTEALVDDYLKEFAAPQGTCVNCGELSSGFFSRMRWGVCWGEMLCGGCGWPGRGYHDPKDENGDRIYDRPLLLPLQYHPSVITKPTQALEDIASNHSDDPVLANIEQGVRDGLAAAQA